MSTTSLAPIVLFAYNRPAHTRRTVEALARNRLATESELIVYSDGPKNAGAATAVDEVRHSLRSGIQGFRSITVVEREKNVGLASSIIFGVTEACEHHGKVIVVEDDLVTSECFLEYMNDALNRYEKDEQVMHISGYMYPVDTTGLPETCFLPPASCWGWATWDRAWQHFHKNPEFLRAQFSATDRRRFNLDNAFPYWTQVEMNAKRQIDTWAIFWYATVFQKGGLCLHPRQSYVQNIGHDDSGQHSDVSGVFDVALNHQRVNHWCADTHIHPLALQRLQSFFRRTLPPRVRVRLTIESMIERLFRNHAARALR